MQRKGPRLFDYYTDCKTSFSVGEVAINYSQIIRQLKGGKRGKLRNFQAQQETFVDSPPGVYTWLNFCPFFLFQFFVPIPLMFAFIYEYSMHVNFDVIPHSLLNLHFNTLLFNYSSNVYFRFHAFRPFDSIISHRKWWWYLHELERESTYNHCFT